jgi:hypothetical protein
MNDFEAWNHQVIEEFRANKGKVNGVHSLLLLTTTGAQERQAADEPGGVHD